MWLDRGRQHVEPLHGLVVAGEVVLHHFHRLELFETGFLGDLVLAVVGVVLEVAYVSDVADVAHLVAQVHQIAVEHVERDGRAGVAEMAVAVDGGSAHIHPHESLVERLEGFLGARHRVIDTQIVGKHAAEDF